MIFEYVPQNKCPAKIGDISEYEWKSYFLSTKKWHEVNFRDFQYKINKSILVTNCFPAKFSKLIV